MKRRLAMAVLLLATLGLGAQEVAEQELKSVQREVVFINYEGPYDRIDTADEIKGLGYYVASSLKRSGQRGAFLGKYSVIRAVDPREQGKFDADIFCIDADAKVDHIDNVRRILAGYLEGAFRYSAEDARTLARFATVYNAVYRKHLEYFSTRYKAVVLSHLSYDNAGLSTRYYEWPGATRMLIPLTSEAAEGRLSSLSTSELSGQEVIEEMRREPDMGLEDRKDMVELKEREVEEKREELGAQQVQLEQQREELAEKRQELAAAPTEEEKERLQEEVGRKETQVREQAATVETTAGEIQKKEEEIATEREQIVADERAREERGGPPPGSFAFSDQLYYLKVRDREPSGSISGTLSIIDPFAPAVTATAPLSHVRGRAFYFLKNTILVLANEDGPGTPARLFQLDPRNLEEVRRSTEELYPESCVLIQSGSIYAVVVSGKEFRLGRFDEELRLAARSSVPVHPDSSLSLFADKVYVNAPRRDILILDRTNLAPLGSL